MISIDVDNIAARLASFLLSTSLGTSIKIDSDTFLVVSISAQTLYLIKENKLDDSYSVSTAKNGIGNEENSGKTPLGIHRIAKKIGDGAELGALFRARKNTQEVTPLLLSEGQYSPIDAITSRILWLDGLDFGVNKGMSLDKKVNVDSYQRYIYIHGTDEEWRLGQPVSHGCIRMSNRAIIKLYDKVCVNTLVVIIK